VSRAVNKGFMLSALRQATRKVSPNFGFNRFGA
jgi:hypothetical protein